MNVDKRGEISYRTVGWDMHCDAARGTSTAFIPCSGVASSTQVFPDTLSSGTQRLEEIEPFLWTQSLHNLFHIGFHHVLSKVYLLVGYA